MEAKPSTKACTSVDGLVAVLEQFTVEIVWPESDVATTTFTGPRMRPVAHVGTLRLPFVLLAVFLVAVRRTLRCDCTQATRYLAP